MHELSVTKDILAILLQQAEAHRVSKIVSVTIEIGPLSDLIEEWLQDYFDTISKNTVAAGAKIKVIKAQAYFLCKECNHRFPDSLKDEDMFCPECKSSRVFLQAGIGYTIKNMEAI